MATSAWYPFYTHCLLDCLDEGEYMALSSNQKTALHLIISAGIINFATNSPCRLKIESMFPNGTITRTNIIQLLTYAPPIT